MSDQSAVDLADKLDALAQGDLLRLLKAGFVKAGAKAWEGAVRNARERLSVRTGQLSRSIRMTVEESGEGVTVTLTADTPYARIQEEGGTVRPVNRKYLRVPLGPALTGAGVDRLPTSLYTSAPDKFFVAKSRKGTLLLRDRETGEPWYALIKGPVTVAPKFYLRDAATEAVRGWVETVGGSVASRVTG